MFEVERVLKSSMKVVDADLDENDSEDEQFYTVTMMVPLTCLIVMKVRMKLMKSWVLQTLYGLFMIKFSILLE